MSSLSTLKQTPTQSSTQPPPVRQALSSQLSQLLASPAYQVISLAGDAGVGKSHLTREVLQGIGTISGKFDTGKDTTLAYAAFIQATRTTLNQLLSLPADAFQLWQAYFQSELAFAPLLPALPELNYFQAAAARSSQLAKPSEIFSETLSLARPFERAFLKLWQCLTAAAQPPFLKVIWLDDVQWMDTASATFLEFLLQQDLPVHWMLTGRNTRAVDHLLQRLNVPHHSTFALQPFSEAETAAFVQNQLGCDALACQELASFLHSLSQGFPLELSWGLKELQQQQKMTYQQGWQFTGQLTELAGAPYKGWGQLMCQQWQRLPAEVQHLLESAMLLGPKFSRQALEQVYADHPDFDSHWQAALASGFLLLPSEQEAMFSHDRLYEWVLEALAPDSKPERHLQIARQLLQDPSSHLELLVEQLNHAAPLLTAPEQQLRLEKNLLLIRNMLSQGAVSQAGKLLQRLAGDIGPASPLYNNFQLLLASQAYLANEMARAEHILLALLQHPHQDLLEAQLLLIVIYTQHNRYEEIVLFTLDLLAELGLTFNRSPEYVAEMFGRDLLKVQQTPVEELISYAQRPGSPQFEAQMKVIAAAASALYNFDPQLYGICILEALDQILHGQGTSRTAVIYAAASILLVNQAGELEAAFKLIAASEQLAAQHGRDDDLTLIHCVMGDFIAPWKITFAATRDYLSSSRAAGQRSGNLQFAGYACVFRGGNLLLDAHPLPELAEAILPELIQFNQRTQNYSPLDGLLAYQYLIGKLREGEFQSGERSEATFIADLRQRESNADLSRYFTFKAFVLLLFGDTQGAAAALEQSQLHIYLPASIARVWHLLLADLLRWRLAAEQAPAKSPAKQAETGKPTDADTATDHLLPFDLKTLAALNPDNFQVLYQIWRAERPGQTATDKLQAYHQAVIAARQQTHWHWEGYALEQMARLLQAQGLELLAQQSLLESILAFQRWGASAKVQHLLPELNADYLAQYQAQNQSLPAELAEILEIYADFSKLLSPTALQEKILQVLKNQTQAHQIELLLKPDEGQGWQCFTLDASQAERLQESRTQVPQALLNYVTHTHQSVILPAQRERFPASDIQHLTGLHLLLPLVFQQSLMGIVYLQPQASLPFSGPGTELLLQALGGYLAGALHNAQRSQNLENLIALHTADLQQANLRLSQLLSERQEVLAIAAHDLKHPLGTLRLGLSMLEQMETALSPEMRQKAFANLSQTLEDMNQNTERLLMIEQMESDILRPQWEPISLKAALKPFLQSYEWKAREKQQQLLFSGFHSKALVETDPSMLKIILNNLLENAIKFSPLGASIQVGLQVSDSTFTIQICDQGPGFSPQDQQQLFSKFGRLSARPTAGESSHGLGLFIVRRLVTDLGGKLQIKSPTGGGAMIAVTFPLSCKQS